MVIDIYFLTDPRDGTVRYVGKAKDSKYRLKAHLKDDAVNRKANWLKRLKSLGLQPTMDIVETVDEGEADESERFWIAFMKSCGASLVNTKNGGEGGPIPHDVRKKISQSHIGIHQTEESLKKIRAARAKQILDPEMLRRLHEGNRGRKLSPEHAAALAASNKTRIISDETRRKMRESHLGRKQSPELIEKRAAACRGKKRTDETKRKIAAGWARRRELGLKKASPTPEVIARRSAAVKATWARKRAAG